MKIDTFLTPFCIGSEEFFIMIDKETGYDYQGMSELQMDIDEGDSQAIAFAKKLARQNNPQIDEEISKIHQRSGVPDYEPIDITPILKQQEQKEKAEKFKKRMKKAYKNALPIFEFCVNTAVQSYNKSCNFDMNTGTIEDVQFYDYSCGCKLIHCQGKTKKNFPQVCFYSQNLQNTDKNLQSFDIIKTVSFRKNMNYYITKNSFIRNIRKSEYLFSFDNIVIDVDNHDSGITVEQTTIEVNKLIKCLDNTSDFLKYSIVRTGRGVHLWIRLESFSARTDSLNKLYNTFCEKLCDVVERVITENSINIKVDRGATTDTARLVRLPYTYNTKAIKENGKYFKTTYEEHTAKKYSLDELCAFFNIKKAKNTDKPIKVKKSKSKAKLCVQEEEKNYVGLHIKRVSFLENIVKNNPNCTSRRNNLIFCYYASCFKLYSIEQAQDLAIRLNNSFTDPLPRSELHATFRSVEKSNHNISIRKVFNLINATEEEIALYNTFAKRRKQREQAKERKQERNQTIRELSEQGVRVKDIAKQVNCCKDTVCKFGADKQQVDYSLILELYKQGLKQKDIAKQVHCAESTVSDVLKPYKQDKKEVIIDLFNQGLKQSEIIKQTGYSKNTVSKILKEYKK